MTTRQKLRRFLRPLAERFVRAQPETREWAALMEEWIATVQQDSMPGSIETAILVADVVLSAPALLDVIVELAGEQRARELWTAICIDIDRYMLRNHAVQGRA